jgi:hypothetical protein
MTGEQIISVRFMKYESHSCSSNWVEEPRLMGARRLPRPLRWHPGWIPHHSAAAFRFFCRRCCGVAGFWVLSWAILPRQVAQANGRRIDGEDDEDVDQQ